MIIDAMPDQLKLPFYLWTRAAVASLISREYGIEVSLVTVGRYLNAWGMSPQKPVKRAYERNDAAIARVAIGAGLPGARKGASLAPGCSSFISTRT